MDDENNEQMQSNDMEQQQAISQAAGNAAGKVADAGKKAASTAKDYATGKKKIVGPAKKAKGKMYAAKGSAKAAAGRAVEAAGMATHAVGTATRGTAAALRAAGHALATVLDLALGAGEAIRPVIESVTKSIDSAGKGIQNTGKKIRKVGTQKRKQGEHDIKRGKTLAQTGKDIGAKDAAIPGMPGSVKKPKIPLMGDFLNGLKKKASKENKIKWFIITHPALFWGILGAIVLFIIILIIILIVASSTDRGKYKEGDNSNVPYVVNQQAINELKIVPDGNGGYTYGYVDEDGNSVSFDEKIDEILKTLDENGSDALEEMGETDEERKNFLKLLIKAEIATQYPDLTGSVQGSSISTTSATASSQWGWLIQNENINAYYYEHNYDNMSYDAFGVNGYITEDRQNYIVVSNNTGLYIGQGIQLYGSGFGWNTYNLDIFKKHGVDASNCKVGDTIDANICDLVSQEIFENVKADIKKQAESKGLTLSENQIVALSDISYLNGNVRTQLNNIASMGVNNDGLANTSGFSPVGENEVATSRSQNAWKLFRYGKYEARSGNPYKPEYFVQGANLTDSSDDTQSDDSGNTQDNSSDDTQSDDASDTKDDNSESSSDKKRKTDNDPESDEINGNIHIKRKDSSGNETYLKYVDESTFNSMVSANDSNVMNYYTLKQGASAGTTGGTPNSLTGSETKEKIWNFLVDSGCTEEGVAAIMGNLLAESGCEPVRVQGDYAYGDAAKYSADYTAKVDSGEVSENDFVHNGPNGGGYGLAQWTDPGRKQKLYTYAKSKGASIGDLQTQLEYLVSELSTNSYYSEIWSLMTTSNDMNKTCDQILVRFENPAVKDYTGRRSNASGIYNTYKGTHVAGSSNNDSGNSGTSGSNSPVTSFDNFLFVGDSRYVGVMNELKALGNNVSVCAVSGSTCEQWVSIASNKSGSVRGTSITLPATASGVSVMLGANSTSQTGELKQVLQNLHATYPNARIYCNSVYHVGSNYRVVNKDTFNANADSFNGEMKTYCNSNSSWLQYIDITEGIHDANGYLAYPDGEGIHLVDPGRAKLVENIKNNIKNGGSNDSGNNTSSGIAKKGQKDSNGVNITDGGNIDFLNCAIDAHMLLREDKFTYSMAGRELPIVRGDSVHYVDCSSYVSMAVETYGLTGWRYYPHQMTVPEVELYGDQTFEKIYDGSASSISQIPNIQSGDIVTMASHTQIFYGYDDNGGAIWLSCGDDRSINAQEGTYTWCSTPILKVYRIPDGLGSYKGNRGSNDSSNTDSKYTLTVASYTSRTTRKVTSYEYSYTDVISTGSGAKGPGSQFSDTPGDIVSESTTYTYNATNLDYQAAMKDHTMYFDFLWAAFIASGDKKYIEELSKLVLDSNIEITIYSDEQTSQDSSTSTGQSVTRSKAEGATAYVDHYTATDTVTIITKTVASKGGVTYADLWNMEYENEAATYREFQSKSMEQIREKVEDDDKFVKIIKGKKGRLKEVYKELYLVERMVEENERVKHVYPIYEYIVTKINKSKTEYNSISEIIDVNDFDLSADEESANTVQVLLYTSLNISSEDKTLLYKAVEAICGPSCDDIRRKKAVTSTILNRVMSSEFPNSVKGVLEAPGQFPNLNYDELSTYTPSEDTKIAVDNILVGGDSSNRAVYVATPSQAKSLGWDDTMKLVFNDGDKTDSSFNYYTTESIEEELKQYETSVKAGTTVPSGTAEKIVRWAESQVGNTSFKDSYTGQKVESKNLSSTFVSSAYHQAGLEYLQVDAKDMPHKNSMKFNSDGSVNYANIPVGAVIVSEGSGEESSGHACLYIGNGYVIEAGGEKIVKSPINQSYGAGNCGPFVGWGFAMSDQDEARNKLVISIGGGSYPQGYTKNDATTVRSTGIEGVYNSGTQTYNVYAQGYNDVWGGIPFSEGTYATSACGATSCAIIASAVDPNATPEDTGKAIYAGLGLTYGSRNTAVTGHAGLSKALDKYGIKHEWRYNSTTQEVIEHLQSGNPVIVNVHNRIGRNYYSGHYVTLLGIDSSGQIFLGDPAGGGNNSDFFDQSQIFPLPEHGVCFVYY